jgi:hypothetical protein
VERSAAGGGRSGQPYGSRFLGGGVRVLGLLGLEVPLVTRPRRQGGGGAGGPTMVAVWTAEEARRRGSTTFLVGVSLWLGR